MGFFGGQGGNYFFCVQLGCVAILFSLSEDWPGEDFVGKISKLAHSVSMGVKATRISRKVLPKYRVMLHVRLARGDLADPFADASKDCDSEDE